MGRIVASVLVENPSAPDKKIHCDALVDTGASHMILPTAWKDRLGPLEEVGRVEFETATQRTTEGIVCGPARLRIEGFRPVFTELVFIQMEPEDGDYEPLIEYIVLEQSQAAVDTLGHRLIHVKRMDLKFCSAVRGAVATA